MSTSSRADAIATEGKAIETAKPADGLVAMMDRWGPEIARALPATWDPVRFQRVLTTEIRKNPRLLEADRTTLIAAMMQAAQLGLTPGIDGYLIPRYSNKTKVVEVSFQTGYKGVVKLMRNSGDIEKVTTAVVREGDEFSVDLGSDPKVTHRLDMRSTEDRPWTHVYAIVWFARTGEWDVEVMDRAQVIKVRDKVKDWSAGPWADHEEEMARKTVLVRGAKRWPMSDEDRRALDADDIVKRSIVPDMLSVPDTSEHGDVLEGYIEGEAIEGGRVCENREVGVCDVCESKDPEVCDDDRGPEKGDA